MEAHLSNVDLRLSASSDAPHSRCCIHLVGAVMHSRLDYCNNLFAGLPANQLTRLQSVLRPAARLVFRLPGRAIVTEAIRDCAALANCHTASDLRVVLAGIQVSLRSGTRLSGSALCVIV